MKRCTDGGGQPIADDGPRSSRGRFMAGGDASSSARRGSAGRRSSTAIAAAAPDPLWIVTTRSLQAVELGAVGWLVADGPDTGAAAIGNVVAAIRRHGGGRPATVVVDDAHLLDDCSADALLQAAVTGAATIVASAAAGEATPHALGRLADDDLVDVVRLEPLTRDETAAAAAELIGGPVSGATAELLWRWTAGLPGLLRAVVDEGQRTGRLHPVDGRWWWSGRAIVPDAMSGLLDRWTGRLGPAAADALDHVALAEPVELEVIDRCTSVGALVELERAGLVVARVRGDGTVIHGGNTLVGPARLAAMSPLRRRVVARGLLRALDPPRDPGDVVQRAALHVDAGIPAPHDLLLAASCLLRLTDPPRARRFAEANHRWNASTSTVADLLDHDVEAGKLAEARAALADVESSATTPDERQRAIEASIAIALFADRDTDRARRLVAEAGGGATLTSFASLVELLAGRPDRAACLAESVLTSPAAEETAVLRAGVTHVACRMLQGRSADALQEAEQLLPLAERLSGELPTSGGMLRAEIAFTRLWRGDLTAVPGAHPATGRWPSPPVARADADPYDWALMAGIVAHLTGDHGTAVQRLRDAVVQQAGGKGVFHAEASAWLVVALCDAGLVREAIAALHRFPERHLGLVPGLHAWASGVVECARGDVEGGIVRLLAAADQARRTGAELIEARYLVEVADRDISRAPIERIRVLSSSIDAPLMERLCHVAIAHAERDAGAMGVLATALADTGLGARSRIAARLAEQLARSNGDHGQARRAGSLVRTLRQRTAPATRPGDLTAREAEVARLAAGGLADREIAARLIVSVRTVESHLARAYRKLGVTSRADLSHALA